jgi:hypothetical protein
LNEIMTMELPTTVTRLRVPATMASTTICGMEKRPVPSGIACPREVLNTPSKDPFSMANSRSRYPYRHHCNGESKCKRDRRHGVTTHLRSRRDSKCVYPGGGEVPDWDKRRALVNAVMNFRLP